MLWGVAPCMLLGVVKTIVDLSLEVRKVSQYSDYVVGWTVSKVTVLWAGKSEQQLCCGLESQYSDCVVGWTVITVTVL